MTPQNLPRDLGLLLGLVVLHELGRRYLAGEAIVSALFAPGGAHATWTLLIGVLFVVLRVVLFVGVPGWLVAQGVMVACGRVTYTRPRTAVLPPDPQ